VTAVTVTQLAVCTYLFVGQAVRACPCSPPSGYPSAPPPPAPLSPLRILFNHKS